MFYSKYEVILQFVIIVANIENKQKKNVNKLKLMAN